MAGLHVCLCSLSYKPRVLGISRFGGLDSSETPSTPPVYSYLVGYALNDNKYNILTYIIFDQGNNENEMVIAAFFRGSKEYRNDYIKLFIEHIESRVTIEDSTRPFVSSSPSNGLESIKENYLAEKPNDNRYGDVHYYNDGGNLWDWKTYPSAKFASEYGFQSYASLKTFSEVLTDSDFTFPVSQAIEHRQRHPGGTGAIGTSDL